MCFLCFFFVVVLESAVAAGSALVADAPAALGSAGGVALESGAGALAADGSDAGAPCDGGMLCIAPGSGWGVVCAMAGRAQASAKPPSAASESLDFIITSFVVNEVAVTAGCQFRRLHSGRQRPYR